MTPFLQTHGYLDDVDVTLPGVVLQLHAGLAVLKLGQLDPARLDPNLARYQLSQL